MGDLMDRVELAYAAGYFDGEGMVTISKSVGSYGIRVVLSNTYKPTVEWLHENFGGVVSRAFKGSSKWRQAWRWQASGFVAYNFLIQVYSYLREKAPQADEALAFYRLYGGCKERRALGQIGDCTNTRTSEQKADQEARYMRVRALKVVEYIA